MEAEQTTPEELETAVIEFTTREEYVMLSCKAIDTIVAMRAEMDEKLMSQQDQRRIKRIIRHSIAVIDECTKEMYDELNDRDEEDED